MANVIAKSTNTPSGGLLTIHIPESIALTDVAMITISGVRVDVSMRSVNSTVVARIESLPTDGHIFNNGPELTVAVVDSSLIVAVSGVTSQVGTDKMKPTVQLIEGFTSAFVQYSSGSTTNGRIAFGARTDTQVRMVVYPPLDGVILEWPREVEAQQQTAALYLVKDQGNEAIYEFRTKDQKQSDLVTEIFEISPKAKIAPTAKLEEYGVQASLYPGPSVTDIPRFNHPLIPTPAPCFIRVIG